MKFQHKRVAVMLLGIAGMANAGQEARQAKPGWTKQNAGVQAKQGKELTPREISKMKVTPETERTLYSLAVFSWMQGPRDAARQVLEKDNPALKGKWNELTSNARNANARGEGLDTVIRYKHRVVPAVPPRVRPLPADVVSAGIPMEDIDEPETFKIDEAQLKGALDELISEEADPRVQALLKKIKEQPLEVVVEE